MQKYTQESHTFVVCAYKESDYLEECICSILEQEVKTKVIISTSTPNKKISEVAEKYGLELFVNPKSGGIADDWNYACVCAETPLITLAHQDDIYCKNYVKDIIAILNECKKPLIAFTDYYELREGKVVKNNMLLLIKRCLLMPLRIKSFRRSRFIRRRILSFGSAICCPSVTLVMDHIETPVFENNMKSNIDWQAWEKISMKDGEFVYLKTPSMMHRIHKESTTSELLEINGRKEEDLLMYKKFWPEWLARIIEYFYQNSEKSNKI